MKSKSCGNEIPSQVLVRGETRVQFKSDRSRSGKGFHIRYEIQPCGGLITEDLTEIRSPGHLNGYLHNLNCTWTIQAPAGKVVELKYEIGRFSLEKANLSLFFVGSTPLKWKFIRDVNTITSLHSKEIVLEFRMKLADIVPIKLEFPRF